MDPERNNRLFIRELTVNNLQSWITIFGVRLESFGKKKRFQLGCKLGHIMGHDSGL